jgi:hypothetical protein
MRIGNRDYNSNSCQQIGYFKGQWHEPVSKIYGLTRRATIANRKSEGERKQEGE